ncbi:MAG: energy transducer TonB [Tannerellaceae bacterium]|nr:energy transducer TonB [Tannerellaceae bacterium]
MKRVLDLKSNKERKQIPVSFNIRLVDWILILIGVIVFLFITLACYMPDTSRTFWYEGDEPVFTTVEKMPEFPGGIDSMKVYIHRTIRYPEKFGDVGIQGRVICNFIVNEDGSISEPTVLRGLQEDLDAEAVRVINSMPKWEPGIQNGKPVKVRYTIPVNFMR